MKFKVAKKLDSLFNYAGLSRLSCEQTVGYDVDGWPITEEVWADPAWETKTMSASRAQYVWGAMKKLHPDLETVYKPHFVQGRKYKLIIEEDPNCDHWLYAYCTKGWVAPKPVTFDRGERRKN